MQHTGSSIKYTVVLDGDVTVCLFVGWLLKIQRDDIYGGEANEMLYKTDADITEPIKCTEKRPSVFEIGITLAGRSELCSRAVPTSATAACYMLARHSTYAHYTGLRHTNHHIS
jgi:hypothetical protein